VLLVHPEDPTGRREEEDLATTFLLQTGVAPESWFLLKLMYSIDLTSLSLCESRENKER